MCCLMPLTCLFLPLREHPDKASTCKCKVFSRRLRFVTSSHPPCFLYRGFLGGSRYHGEVGSATRENAGKPQCFRNLKQSLRYYQDRQKKKQLLLHHSSNPRYDMSPYVTDVFFQTFEQTSANLLRKKTWTLPIGVGNMCHVSNLCFFDKVGS